MYPVSHWRKFIRSCTDRRQVERVMRRLVYHDEEGKEIEQEYGQQEPPPLRSEVARDIRQTASRKATGPDEVPTLQQNCSKQEERQYWTECTEYVWWCGKLASGQRYGRSPRLSHFPRKVILSSVQITEQLLLSHMQAGSFFGSYWKGSEWILKQKLQTNRRHSDNEGEQGTKSRISEYWCTRHVSTSNHSICDLWTSRRHSTLSPMISSGWLWWTWDILCTWLTCWSNCTGKSWHNVKVAWNTIRMVSC